MRNQLLKLQDVSVPVAENNSGRIQVTHIRCAAVCLPMFLQIRGSLAF